MKVVIMAGGFGSRLKSALGKDIPKPLAQVGERSVISSQIRLCMRYGMTSFIILLHHLAEKIIRHITDDRDFDSCDIQFVIEKTPRGTGGALYDIRDKLDTRFVVMYGDVYVDVDLQRLIRGFKGDGVLVTHPNDHPYDSDLVEADSTGRILDFTRKVDGEVYKNSVNAALYCLSPNIFSFDSWSETGSFDLGRDVFPFLADRTDLFKYDTVEYLKDIGTPERLKKVNEDFYSGYIESRSKAPRKAIFLDRDGVINRLNGYVTNPKQIEIHPSVFAAIRLINQSKYLCIVVTNQPIIARGDISESELEYIHDYIESELGNNNCFLDDLIYCPHHPDGGFPDEISELKFNCCCRKPEPGMLYQMAIKHSLVLSQCYMIGDSDVDVIAATRANVRAVKIKSNTQDLLKEVEKILALE